MSHWFKTIASVLHILFRYKLIKLIKIRIIVGSWNNEPDFFCVIQPKSSTRWTWELSTQDGLRWPSRPLLSFYTCHSHASLLCLFMPRYFTSSCLVTLPLHVSWLCLFMPCNLTSSCLVTLLILLIHRAVGHCRIVWQPLDCFRTTVNGFLVFLYLSSKIHKQCPFQYLYYAFTETK